MKNGRWIKISFPFLLLAGIYFLGPAPDHPNYSETFPAVPEKPDDLIEFIDTQEHIHKLKPDNEARIVWHDSSRTKTEYSVVYLHGFSASQKEADPVHRRFAEEFGCNLYLFRLADHGIDTMDALYNFTAERAWESAKEGLAIGRQIGNKVILLSTSTGGTLALLLAAKYPDKVFALINLSPNVAINDPAAFILNDPWGLYIARMVMGGKFRDIGATLEEAQYWNARYRIEALVQLEELLESTMTDATFHNVKQPSLTLYYYKNEQEQDPQVRVSSMLEMNRELSTPDSMKVAKAIPDADAHVIGSSMTSRDVEGVYRQMKKFAIDKLKMRPVPLSPETSLAGVK